VFSFFFLKFLFLLWGKKGGERTLLKFSCTERERERERLLELLQFCVCVLCC
jgi:hypothetical protein